MLYLLACWFIRAFIYGWFKKCKIVSWTRPFPGGAAYWLEIISALSVRVWRTSITWLVVQIYRFCILLIGIEWPKGQLIEYNRREWCKMHAALPLLTTRQATLHHLRLLHTINWPLGHSTPINNIQDLYICRTSHVMEVLQTLSKGVLIISNW